MIFTSSQRESLPPNLLIEQKLVCPSGFTRASGCRASFSACRAFALTMTASPSVVNTEAATETARFISKILESN